MVPLDILDTQYIICLRRQEFVLDNLLTFVYRTTTGILLYIPIQKKNENMKKIFSRQDTGTRSYQLDLQEKFHALYETKITTIYLNIIHRYIYFANERDF